MKTFKFYKAIYVATYIGIIALAVFRIVEKVRGCKEHKCKCCHEKPLFEADESGHKSGYTNLFAGTPHVCKKWSETAAFASTPKGLGVDFWERQLDRNPVESSREITLARHKELDEIMKQYADAEEANRRSEEQAKDMGF